jgi:hypothetical protein
MFASVPQDCRVVHALFRTCPQDLSLYPQPSDSRKLPQFARRFAFGLALAEPVEFLLKLLTLLFESGCEHGERPNRHAFAKGGQLGSSYTGEQI